MKWMVIAGLLIGSIPVNAEVKPEGTVLETYCGVNTLEQSKYVEACLAVAQGKEDVSLVVLKTAKGKQTVLPIVARKAVAQNNKSLSVETLTYTDGSIKREGNYNLLRSAQATLSSRLKSIPGGGGLYKAPSKLHGWDLDANEFKVDELSPVAHTESVPTP